MGARCPPALHARYWAIVGTKAQKDVWFPGSNDMGRIIIGKFTAGSANDGNVMTRRVVIDQAELDFLVHDLGATNSPVGYDRPPGDWGHVLTYDGSQPQYTHSELACLTTSASTCVVCSSGLILKRFTGWRQTRCTSARTCYVS